MLDLLFKIYALANPVVYPSSINGYAINKCHLGDSVQILRGLPSESVPIIIVDPPFAINHGKTDTSNYNRSPENVLPGYVEVPVEEYPEFCHNWISESYRVLEKYGSLVIVSGWSNQRDILNAVWDAGFYLTSQIIWKQNFGVFTSKRFVSSHFNVFFCTKHKTKFTFNKLLWYEEDVIEFGDIPVDVWNIKKEYWTGKYKPPNKLPVELVEMLVAHFSIRNDLVLDLFSGSGTILDVSLRMGRNCLAFEIVPEYVTFANQRVLKVAGGDFRGF